VIVIAAGEMGSAVGRKLVQGGARVLTSLAGRSAASRARAEASGLIAVEDEARLVAGADFLLSIVPPGSALDFARRMAGPLRAANGKPSSSIATR
jgi:3-hydroxyisobutyrate dehydrogenase-like beta-hydroxyacid dehydrogenase